MNQTSGPDGGSPLDRKLRERARKDARIIDKVLKEALTDCKRRVTDSAQQWNAALDSTAAVMERRLRRMWLFPLAGLLSGTALTLLILWAGLWLAGDRLIWPQLETRALNRAGYRGPLSVEWEDAGMDREHGAEEACAFVRKLAFPPSNTAFDAAFAGRDQ
jgi:hypothetical protein